jgi:hypothetical protein
MTKSIQHIYYIHHQHQTTSSTSDLSHKGISNKTKRCISQVTFVSHHQHVVRSKYLRILEFFHILQTHDTSEATITC